MLLVGASPSLGKHMSAEELCRKLRIVDSVEVLGKWCIIATAACFVPVWNQVSGLNFQFQQEIYEAIQTW